MRWQPTHNQQQEPVQDKPFYNHQVLLSQDYDLYDESKRQDGIQRYCAFFNEFVPSCIENGISPEVMESMMTTNPAAFFDIHEGREDR